MKIVNCYFKVALNPNKKKITDCQMIHHLLKYNLLIYLAMNTSQSTRHIKDQIPTMSKTFTNTVTIPASELMHLQAKIQGQDETTDRMKEKLELKSKSQERMKKWPNTINAYRKNKDAFRFERFKADEEARRIYEQEEAIHQQKVKKETLFRANQQIYEHNDRIRQFQSKMLLSDAMQERDAQIELNKYKQDQEYQYNLNWERIMEENRQIEEEKEQLKIKKLEEKRKEQHRVLKQQHQEFKEKFVKSIIEDKIDGEVMKMKAIEEIEKENQRALARKQKQLQNIEDVLKNNEMLMEYKIEQVKKEKEADLKIEEYAQKKLKIADMRKIREELKFKERQEQRQKMIDLQIKDMEEKLKKKEDYITKQIVEAEVKAENLEKVKKEKREELIRKIDFSHQIKEEVKAKELIQMKSAEKDFQSYWNTRNMELQAQEVQERENMKKRNREMQDYHSYQMKEKQVIKLKQKFNQDIREKDIMNTIEDLENRKKKLEEEDRIFEQWAHKRIVEQNNQGKNILPLIKELKQFQYK